jgi:hypothetical protein
MRTRTRTTVIVATVTAAVLAGGVAPATAVSERSAAARAVAGRMLAAPRPEALVTRLPVRVVVRVPAGTSRLWVRVGGRDVTARFRRTRGSLRVAHLIRGDGLRYGPNHVVVRAERRGRRPVAEARSFVLARRQDGLVRLRIRRGPVTSLDVRVAAPGLAAEHFGQPGEVERRLSVIRRSRTVRVWLNGRRVTRALDRSHPTRWTASLSASHGLRYGVNRLRLLVAEPDGGRYALLRRRFVVRRNRHLAAAGWDTATRVGGRVRLDGHRSRTAHGGRPAHSWRILSRPRGSRAKLRRAASARPLLAPDRRGRYVVGLTVTSRTKRAAASQASASSSDRVTLTVAPASLLVPFKGFTVENGRGGIQVGDTFYPNPSSDGKTMQWLTLNRATLKPCDAAQPCGPSKNVTTGNSWFDPFASNEHSLQALTDALTAGGNDELVILAKPMHGFSGPVKPDQVDAFNNALKLIGVGPIDPSTLRSPGPYGIDQQLVIVGVPYGGDGSGWYSQVFSELPDVLSGWLMPDGVPSSKRVTQFRFQPERAAFDTSSSKTPTTNTMTIRKDPVTASLPAGQTGGFQVVELDPHKFTVVRSDAYGYNGQLEAMAARLNQIRDQGSGYVAVQSIGRSAGFPAVARALADFGANPHSFMAFDGSVDGSYAFVGGTKLARSEVVESSSTVASGESGTLRGRARIRADGLFKPAVADPAETLELEMYDFVFRAPTPWPYTKGGSCSPPDPSRLEPLDDSRHQFAPLTCSDPQAEPYAKALAYISLNLQEFNGWGPDLRQAYTGHLRLNYTMAALQLDRLDYPGDGHTCTQGPGRDIAPNPDFSRRQFCNLHDELQLEFGWLDKTQNLFDTMQQGLYRSGGQEQVDLQSIGTKIKDDVAPPRTSATEILIDVGEFVLLMAEAVALAGPDEVLGFIEAVAGFYELATTLASDVHTQTPLGDEIQAKVDDLSLKVANRLSDSATGLDSLQQVIVSDYGRLRALGSVAGTPSWTPNANDMAGHLGKAGETLFYSELMPVAYGVYGLFTCRQLLCGALRGSGHPPFVNPNADDCFDQRYGHIWRGAPATAQMVWRGGVDLDSYSADVGTADRFVLGRHTLSITYYAYPPETLTNPMFRAPTQGGLGMQLERFVWEQYEAPPGSKFPPTDIGTCG